MATKTDLERQFDSIIEQNGSVIKRVCYMYANDSDHFKDLYQESLINIWQGLKKFRGDSKISTWIYRTCLNTCISYFRKNGKYSDAESIDNLFMEPEDDNSEHLSNLREMYRLISKLRKLDRAIILLWLDEKPYDEIAEITGLSRNNVASRLRRIKESLAKSANS